jgi:hypothetical protein
MHLTRGLTANGAAIRPHALAKVTARKTLHVEIDMLPISKMPEYITTLAEIKARDADGLALPTSDFAIETHRDRHWLLARVAKLEAALQEICDNERKGGGERSADEIAYVTLYGETE